MPGSTRFKALFTLATAASACALLGLSTLTMGAEAQKPMTNSPAATLPPGAIEVMLTPIMDNQGYDKPTVAARALVPKGWRTEGGVMWNRGRPDCAEPATFGWSAISPDGHSRVELIPTEVWQASTSLQSQCQYGEFQDMRSYLTAYIQRRYPGAQPTDYRQRMDFLDLQKEFIQAKIALINNNGLGMRAWADAGELTYTARVNGADIEGVVGGTAMFYLTQVDSGFGGPPMRALSAQTTSAFGASGPKGKFDRKMSDAIRKSVKPDAVWAQNYMTLLTKIGGMNVEATRNTAAIIIGAGAAMTANTIAANNAAVANAAKNSYADPMPAFRANNESSDRIQDRSIDGIRGVETYADPVYGGTVKLDNTYDHAWRVNNADAYILTNDPNFNPGAYNIDAQQLQAVR